MPAWKQKVCPDLSAGRSSEAQRVQVPGGSQTGSQQVILQGCVGPKCMLFIPEAIPDAEGNPIFNGEGNCAHTVNAISASNLVQVVAQTLMASAQAQAAKASASPSLPPSTPEK